MTFPKLSNVYVGRGVNRGMGSFILTECELQVILAAIDDALGGSADENNGELNTEGNVMRRFLPSSENGLY
eukprot:CAMPEP_0170565526 /NCGR_PEP_ID=MMETSP0211-20121228/79247_1 /TAXON_ID=311385 /ORGANISM="Pseudokeronopsis sp., Strain OXSARD2" /LENGTH=70 /DNA_ID=CAMNT_0010886425 /DNA_START=290 /DNA_END=502 /DNA_ORIENTATION=-